ncbi:hypothetical protein KAU51_02140 [Candidatus Parcubacteria bacterium]|nr:hypothetical protein [Candidatus Parcubacteria bacterium]
MLQDYFIVIGWILVIGGWFATYFLLKKKEIEASKYKIKLDVYAKFIEIMYQYSNIDNLFKGCVFSISLKKRGWEITNKMTEIYDSEAQLRLVAPPNIVSEVESLTIKILEMLSLWSKTNKVNAKKLIELVVDINEQKNRITNLMRDDLGVKGLIPD